MLATFKIMGLIGYLGIVLMVGAITSVIIQERNK